MKGIIYIVFMVLVIFSFMNLSQVIVEQYDIQDCDIDIKEVLDNLINKGVYGTLKEELNVDIIKIDSKEDNITDFNGDGVANLDDVKYFIEAFLGI